MCSSPFEREWYSFKKNSLKRMHRIPVKQDAAHEPECSHVEPFSETSYLNSLHVSPVTVPVNYCRLWNAEEGGVYSVECGV